jgi:hypothetical protein
MYPSGVWEGFWKQEGLGRQPMAAFRLKVLKGEVTGGGVDVIGRFVMAGEYDPQNGAVTIVKQYLGKHKVLYQGSPDGEGCIAGEWTVRESYFGTDFVNTGPFLMRPERPDITGDEPVQEIEF